MTNTIPTIDELNINYQTMSARIRKLDSCGLTRWAISKHLNIRYQWVRNVLETKVKNPKEQINK